MTRPPWLAWLARVPRRWWPWLALGALGLILALSTLLTPIPETFPGGAQPPGTEALNSAGLAFNILGKLGLVIVLIYGSLFLLRRWQGGAFTARPRQVQVLETTRLSPRQALHVVRVGERTLLVGATDQALTVLTELERAPSFDAVLTDLVPEAELHV